MERAVEEFLKLMRLRIYFLNMGKKEKLELDSLEGQVEELRMDVFKVFELLLPPKEIRREVMRNLYTIELSFWKIFKTLEGPFCSY